MLVTLANENPFSFDTEKYKTEAKIKAHKRNKNERDKYIFKANPIPWYCSVNILQKNKET